ncbi:MAG: hypothetical protein ACR2NP_16230 [Pirellulaceae bacterium]
MLGLPIQRVMADMVVVSTLIAVLCLTLVHLLVGRKGWLDRHAEIWKSVSGGVGIAYVFLAILPKLAKAQEVLDQSADGGVYGFLVHHSWLLALAGLVVYYGIDSAVEQISAKQEAGKFPRPVIALICLHGFAVAGYYFIISYLILEGYGTGRSGFIALTLFALAMLLHYLSIDHSLRFKYGELYDRYLRWIFALATLGGWLAAQLSDVSRESLALCTSFFAGGLIVFTLKDKVPGSSSVNFLYFLAGVAGFSALLLTIEALAQMDF